MNWINILGIIFAVGVMVASMVVGNPNPGKLLDYHGLLVVVGGTLACVGVAFQLDRAAKMVWIFIRGMFRTRKPDVQKTINDLILFADMFYEGSPNLENEIKANPDPFLREALLNLKENLLDEEKLMKVLKMRVDTMYARYSDEAKMFAACGKYPPAMGLMGAVLGMILLLGTLGQPGAEKNVGPAMSVALIATLYGICFANLFIIPIGENLQEVAKSLRTKNQIIVEGVRLIAQKTNPIILTEELNAFLLPSERVERKAS